MIRKVALCAALFALTGCATRSLPDPEPAERPKPQAQDPALCAPIEAEPPVRGGLVQPATRAEREATAEFLAGEAEARAWGREGWRRAQIARQGCGK